MQRLSTHASPSDSCSNLPVLKPVCSSLGLPQISIGEGRISIGSAPGANLVVDIPGVEPRHCLLITSHGRTIAKAFSPKTWLNDGVLHESLLKNGDRLTIGPVEFFVKVVTDGTVGSAPASASAQSVKSLFSSPAIPEQQADIVPVAPPSPPPGQSLPHVVYFDGDDRSHVANPRDAQATRAALRPASKIEVPAAFDTLASAIQELTSPPPKHVQSETSTAVASPYGPIAPGRTGDTASGTLSPRPGNLESKERELVDRLKRLSQRHTKSYFPEPAREVPVAASAELQGKRDRDFPGLKDREEELARRSATLARLSHDLRKRQQTFLERLDSLKEREQSASRRDQEAMDREKLIAQQSQKFQRQQDELQTEQSRLEQQQLLLVQTEANLAEQQQELLADKAAQEALCSQMEAMQAALAAREQQLLGREEDVRRLVERCDEREHILVMREAEIDDRKQHIEQQSLLLNESELRLASERAALTEASNLHDLVVSDFQSEQANTSQRLTAELESVQRMQSQLAEREAEVRSQEEAAVDRDLELQLREQSLTASQAELEHQRAQLDQEAALLDSKSEEFAIRSQSLESREQQLGDEQAQLQEWQQRLHDIETDLSTREASLRAACADHDGREQLLAARELELEQRTLELNETQRGLLVREGELDQRQAAIDAAEGNQSRLLEEVTASQSQIDSQQAELQGREQELQSARQQLLLERDEFSAHRTTVETQWEEERRQLRSDQELLEESRRSLDEERVEIVAQRDNNVREQQAIEYERSELENERQSLDRLLQECTSQQEALESERLELQQTRDELDCLQLDLISAQQELAAAKLSPALLDDLVPVDASAPETVAEESQEQLSLLASQLQDLRNQLADWEQRGSSLQQLEQELSIRRANLDDLAAALTDREESIVQDELQLGRETGANADCDEQLIAEVATERASLAQLRERLVADQAALLETRRQLEQSALEVKRTAAAADVQQQSAEVDLALTHRTRELEQLADEVELRQQQLDAQSADLDVERRNLQSLRNELAEERSRLDYERHELSIHAERLRQLEAESNQRAQIRIEPDTNATSLCVGDTHATPDVGVVAVDGSLAEQTTEQIQSDDFSDVADVPTESPQIDEGLVTDSSDVESISKDAPPALKQVQGETSSESDPVLALRSQLAAMFGLQNVPTHPGNDRQNFPEESDAGMDSEIDTDSSKTVNSNAGPERSATQEVQSTLPQVAAADDSVSAYMQQLLSRARSNSPTAAENSAASVAVGQMAAVPFRPSTSVLPVATKAKVPLAADSADRQKKETEAKESIRVNLDSFRELANISARSAVARAGSVRKRTRFNMYLAAMSLGWLATIVLVYSELTRETPQYFTAVFGLLFSLVFTFLSIAAFVELKKLEATVYGAPADVDSERAEVQEQSEPSSAPK